MSDLLPATIPNDRTSLVAKMNAAIELLSTATSDEAGDVRRAATITEVAAKAAKAEEVQMSAARLRLIAERRLGQLAATSDLSDEYSAKEIAGFVRLAKIPEKWETVLGVGAEPVEVSLWEKALEHQLDVTRSQTAYAVYKYTLEFSMRRQTRYPWAYRTWDGSWVFLYRDPVTERTRMRHFDGSLEALLEERATLTKKITPLLSIKGYGPASLGQVLQQIRAARRGLDEIWSGLSQEQRRELDGIYGRLDDAAHALVVAANL